MLKIRLKRIGRKKKPFYKIILLENLSKINAKYFIELGFYDPLNKIIKINKLKLYKYLNFGAYPTNTVRHLIYKKYNSIFNL